MKRIILLLILQNFVGNIVKSQSFNVDNLITLAAMQPKNMDRFMNKNGYTLYNSQTKNDTLQASFGIKIKTKNKYAGPNRTIEVRLCNESKYYSLHTSSLTEFTDGEKSLLKSGFFYDSKKDITRDTAILFQKGNLTIQANRSGDNEDPQYGFKLLVKKIPVAVKYAEDLLQFDSHEFLVSFFGEQNVKKDMYYFSEKELQKCSVLFSGTKYQVVFVWGDENNLNNLSYILIPHKLPTAGAEKNNAITGNNEWQFKSGIYPGMDLRELLRINEMDFDIYGSKSDLAFMVKPMETGKIDFKKTAVTLSCNSCDDIKIFNKKVISALDVAKQDVPMYVNDVIIYPSSR